MRPSLEGRNNTLRIAQHIHYLRIRAQAKKLSLEPPYEKAKRTTEQECQKRLAAIQALQGQVIEKTLPPHPLSNITEALPPARYVRLTRAEQLSPEGRATLETNDANSLLENDIRSVLENSPYVEAFVALAKRVYEESIDDDQVTLLEKMFEVVMSDNEEEQEYVEDLMHQLTMSLDGNQNVSILLAETYGGPSVLAGLDQATKLYRELLEQVIAHPQARVSNYARKIHEANEANDRFAQSRHLARTKNGLEGGSSSDRTEYSEKISRVQGLQEKLAQLQGLLMANDPRSYPSEVVARAEAIVREIAQVIAPSSFWQQANVSRKNKERSTLLYETEKAKLVREAAGLVQTELENRSKIFLEPTVQFVIRFMLENGERIFAESLPREFLTGHEMGTHFSLRLQKVAATALDALKADFEWLFSLRIEENQSPSRIFTAEHREAGTQLMNMLVRIPPFVLEIDRKAAHSARPIVQSKQRSSEKKQSKKRINNKKAVQLTENDAKGFFQESKNDIIRNVEPTRIISYQLGIKPAFLLEYIHRTFPEMEQSCSNKSKSG